MPAVKWVKSLLLSSALVALGGSSVFAAENLQLKRCGKVTTVASTSTGETVTVLTSVPGIICSVDFTSTGANGFVRIVDSPDGTLTHAQALTVGEASAATAANDAHAYYGELGRLTQFGITVESFNGVAVIAWDD